MHVVEGAQEAAPPPVDRRKLRRERLDRLRRVLQKADCAAALFLDPINIRYATDVSNMQVWCLHNPTRYSFVAGNGPVVLEMRGVLKLGGFGSQHHIT